jgi:hypothetical protein
MHCCPPTPPAATRSAGSGPASCIDGAIMVESAGRLPLYMHACMQVPVHMLHSDHQHSTLLVCGMQTACTQDHSQALQRGGSRQAACQAALEAEARQVPAHECGMSLASALFAEAPCTCIGMCMLRLSSSQPALCNCQEPLAAHGSQTSLTVRSRRHPARTSRRPSCHRDCRPAPSCPAC